MDQVPGDRHRYFEELAVSHVLGGLSESDGRVFRSHLLDCPQCRARVGELRRIANDLADVERDERRVKAAKAIETKRRETDEEDADFDESPPDPRRSRLVALVGLIVVVALAGWNIYLRAENNGYRRSVEGLELTRDLLVDGTFGRHRSPTGLFADAEVRYDAEHALIVVDGVADVEEFIVYQTNAAGDVVDSGRQAVTGDRLTLLVDRAPNSATIFLTTLAEGQRPKADQVTGQRALEAILG